MLHRYSCHVLLIEDNPDDVFFVTNMLSEANHPTNFRLLHATRLADGLEQLAESDVEVVLLDLNLPDTHGPETFRHLQKEYPDVPVVVMSGLDDMDMATQAVAAGAQDYLVKGMVDGITLKRVICYAIERQALRKNLCASETRLRKIIEHNADGVVIVDAKGRVNFVNPAAEALIGYTHQEMVGAEFGFPLAGEGATEIEMIHRQGNISTVEMRVVETEWEGQPAFLASLRDITQRKKMQEDLSQARKMEAVGIMAGGIAHEFNNILTSINGHAELMQMKMPLNDPRRCMLDRIISSGHRAADLVSKMLAFARKQMIQPRQLDLNALLVDLTQRLKDIVGSDIQLQTELQTGLWSINVDPTQVEQVVISLVSNAIDAMPAGGRLVIQSRNVRLDEKPAAEIPGESTNRYVLLTLTDTGVGMSEEARAHVFEPFFTTKCRAVATGLGLASVFGIVKQNDGEIEFESREGQGTTFRIYWPAYDELPVDMVDESQCQTPFWENFAEQDCPVTILKNVGESQVSAESTRQ